MCWWPCCHVNGAIGPGILMWIGPGMASLRTCPCVVKYSAAGVLQWVQDPGFEPREIAVDDVDSVYLRLLSGLGGSAAKLNQTSGLKTATLFQPGLGRQLNHPSGISGTFKLANFGPGVDSLLPGSDVALIGDSNNPVSSIGHWSSNSSKEYIYLPSGGGGGRYRATGSVAFTMPFLPAQNVSAITDVWLADNGDTYILGTKAANPSQGWLYKWNNSGVRQWVIDAQGCYSVITGDNAGFVYLAGGQRSVSDSSNVLKLNDSDGSDVWGAAFGLASDVFDVAVDSGGNVATAGRAGSGIDNIHYLNSSGTIVWSGNNHPHNGTFSGEAWAVCFDSAGYVYATGRRVCN